VSHHGPGSRRRCGPPHRRPHASVRTLRCGRRSVASGAASLEPWLIVSRFLGSRSRSSQARVNVVSIRQVLTPAGCIHPRDGFGATDMSRRSNDIVRPGGAFGVGPLASGAREVHAAAVQLPSHLGVGPAGTVDPVACFNPTQSQPWIPAPNRRRIDDRYARLHDRGLSPRAESWIPSIWALQPGKRTSSFRRHRRTGVSRRRSSISAIVPREHGLGGQRCLLSRELAPGMEERPDLPGTRCQARTGSSGSWHLKASR
jgi:hypothetical protein